MIGFSELRLENCGADLVDIPQGVAVVILLAYVRIVG
jgi:hypothetical protein